MSDTWLTIAEAAAHLKVHTRTIERRIASGKIQSRRTDDGHLQVSLFLPDESEANSDTAFETVRELAADQVSLATGSASALVKFAQDDASRARDELGFVRQQAQQARRTALTAWLVVAGLVLATTIAVGWTASRMTKANADVRQLSDYAQKLETKSQQLSTDLDAVRQDATNSKLAAADAKGQLSAYVENNKHWLAYTSQRSTTAPSGIMQQLGEALARLSDHP